MGNFFSILIIFLGWLYSFIFDFDTVLLFLFYGYCSFCCIFCYACLSSFNLMFL